MAAAAYGREHLLSPRCYLAARWILVWAEEPVSVCTTPCPKIHAAPNKPKESVAWKAIQKQAFADTSHWTFTSTIP